jgi:hypothetical protein
MPISSVRDFLREMAVLAGQGDAGEPGDAGDNPVLELQIGDIVAVTTIKLIDGAEYLVVTAWLPISTQSRYLPARTEECCAGHAPSRKATILWNAERQRYVATRLTLTQDLKDDRRVMDTILETVDEASAWQSMVDKLELR